LAIELGVSDRTPEKKSTARPAGQTSDPRHVEIAWHEAVRIAALVSLDVQTLLDQAEAALPDPVASARARAASADAPAHRPSCESVSDQQDSR
jgi:hypothetical protein